jgi:GNAT superfamily N-acetyltransferase
MNAMIKIYGDAIGALIDALHDDPFYQAITLDSVKDEERRQMLAHYFRYSMQEARRFGKLVFADDAKLGAALWLLPTSAADSLDARKNKNAFLLRKLGARGLENYRRIVDFMSPLAAKVVATNAWYLSIIGIAPQAQGQGVGARLLAQTLREADSIGARCYLETFEPRNVSFYQRLGFSAVASHLEPVTNSTYVIMQR